MSEENNNNKSWWEKYGIIIIILFSVFIIAYLIVESIKQRKKESKEESKVRFQHLLNRKKKLEELVSRRTKLKRRLDLAFRIFYFISRLILITIIGFGFYTAKWYYDEPLKLENYLTWGAVLGILFSGLMYLIIGNPSSVIDAIKEVKPRLQSKIYGKYLNIDDSIFENQEEVINLDNQLEEINQNFDEEK